MRVVVGPIPSSSAVAFAEFAAAVLEERGPELPDDVRAAFAGYVAEWRAAEEQGPVLTWQTDTDVEVAEYLVLAFYRLAQQIDATRQDEEPLLPADVTPFYQALVAGLLAAMSQAGPAASEFSDHLRAFWPGEWQA